MIPFRPGSSSPGGKRQVSDAGGLFPHWRQDGKKIFFAQPDLRLVAAQVTPGPDSMEIGEVRVLFGPAPAPVYEVSADGQRFLIPANVNQRSREPFTLIENWAAGLKKMTPG